MAGRQDSTLYSRKDGRPARRTRATVAATGANAVPFHYERQTMLYIIKPDGHLTEDQRIRIRVDLEKQLTDGGCVVVLPNGCSIETLDMALASAGFTPARAPLWKRAARALGFFRVEQLADLDDRIRATVSPQAPPVRSPPPPEADVRYQKPVINIIGRANGAPPKETHNGIETRKSIQEYREWLIGAGYRTCDHDYSLCFGSTVDYRCIYCSDFKTRMQPCV